MASRLDRGKINSNNNNNNIVSISVVVSTFKFLPLYLYRTFDTTNVNQPARSNNLIIHTKSDPYHAYGCRRSA